MKKVDTCRIAEAYGYDPDNIDVYDDIYSRRQMTGNVYHIAWTERQAAEDIIDQFKQHYGKEPEVVTVTTRTKYLIKK